ncbi:MAG: GNAT family N-acetyltransferase [Nocardioidaceae bacterium]
MPPRPLLIRAVPYDLPATSAMIGELQAYYRTLYDAPDPSPVDPQEFTPPAGRFFAGYLDDAAVAMGGWRWIEALPGIGALRPVEIKRMYVATSARGQGCARRLLGHLEVTAHEAGADAVVLSTGPAQRDAIALYRSAGYDDVPKFGFFAAYEQAVHLGKRLTRMNAPVSGPRPDGTGR